MSNRLHVAAASLELAACTMAQASHAGESIGLFGCAGAFESLTGVAHVVNEFLLETDRAVLALTSAATDSTDAISALSREATSADRGLAAAVLLHPRLPAASTGEAGAA